MQLPAQSAAASDHQHARAMPGSVGADALQTGAVGSDAIADGSVGTAELASSVYGTGTTTIDPDDTVSHGSSSALARTDHQHPATAGTPDALTKTATSAENNGTTWARNNHTHATSALPWGIVAYQELTSVGSGFTADGTSDFALASVVVDSTRLYRVHLHAQCSLSATAEWHVNLHVDGTQVGRFFITESAVTHKIISSSVLWLPTSGTKSLDVRLDEIGGSATFTFQASATVPRQFWVEDIGPR